MSEFLKFLDTFKKIISARFDTMEKKISGA
jgi:hypothetical protein